MNHEALIPKINNLISTLDIRHKIIHHPSLLAAWLSSNSGWLWQSRFRCSASFLAEGLDFPSDRSALRLLRRLVDLEVLEVVKEGSFKRPTIYRAGRLLRPVIAKHYAEQRAENHKSDFCELEVVEMIEGAESR